MKVIFIKVRHMRTVIVYYSYSGNTHRVAQNMGETLKVQGHEVTLVRITPLNETRSFLGQCLAARKGDKPELYKTLTDLSAFDNVVIGCPVWAFKPAPAVNTYIDVCDGLKDKKAVCFVTYGSGVGKDATLNLMKKMLSDKGAQVKASIAIQQNDIKSAKLNDLSAFFS